MAWWVGWPPKSVEALGERFLLWEGSGGLHGFASFEPDENDFSVFLSLALTDTKEAAHFEEEALAWASRGGASVLLSEFDDETAAIERWRVRGFRPTGAGLLNLTRRLEAALGDGPADERVGSVGDDDVEGRASVTYAAFGNSKPFAEYVADYTAFRASPAYPNGWDLLLRDEAGRAAACTIAWIDPDSRAATFEPVATHPDLHRRGHGRALLLDGLRRFAAAGMTYAIVGVNTDNPGAEALYRSVGFTPDRLLRVYERPSARSADQRVRRRPDDLP